ncbi:MAG: hypothetical protein R3F61_18195 [Myxococcota bacterium]
MDDRSQAALRASGPLCMAACWLGAAALHPFVPRDPVGLEPPSAPVLAALSGGHPTAAASGAWSATVVHFANTTPDAGALEAGIRTSVRFDPTFQPPLVNGVMMLRQVGATDRIAPLLELGLRAHPGEAWFPWAMAMHVWLDDDDPEQAAVWLDRAAALAPDAIHARAAEALRSAE